MSGNQPNTPTLLSGLKNNIGAKLAMQPSAPQASAMNQQLVQHGGQVPQMQAPADMPEMMSLFGLTLQKKYFYLLGLIVLIVVGYFLYSKWSKGKKSEEQEDDNPDENAQAQFAEHMRAGRYPPMMPPQYGGRPPGASSPGPGYMRYPPMGKRHPMHSQPGPSDEPDEPEQPEQPEQYEQEQENEHDDENKESDK